MESGGGIGSAPAPFLSKTYEMVDDPATDTVVSWSNGNNSFVVWNVPDFTTKLLPKHFKHNNFSSFVRQLNTYGFKKVDPDRWEFANEGFLRGQKHLLKTITRRKPSHTQSQQPTTPVQSTAVGSCVEVGKVGIEEDVEMLKRDKNILMQELVRLRQQQQSTDHRLQTVGERVHGMEQRQQQMMSFLAKAVQSPGFVAQLVHQQNDSNSNRQISAGNKKRRLPNQDGEDLAPKYSLVSPDGKIVKYQPLMNEAAKSMLRQIMKMNTSSRLDSKSSNVSGFLTDNVHPPSDVSDSGSSSNRLSGVTLSEFLPTQTETQSSSGQPHEMSHDTLFSQSNTTLPDFVQVQGFTPQKSVDLPDGAFEGSETVDMGYMDTLPGFVDTPIPAASDELSGDDDDDGDILLDDMHKLPGINDVFWEQFLESPLLGDTDEITTFNFEHGIGKDQLTDRECEWNQMKNLNTLTEQMGLLESASKSR